MVCVLQVSLQRFLFALGKCLYEMLSNNAKCTMYMQFLCKFTQVLMESIDLR